MEPPAEESRSTPQIASSASVSDQEHVQLYVEFRSVQNLVVTIPSSVSESPSHPPANTKSIKSHDGTARRPSRSAPVNPQIVIEVDAIDSQLPSIRSEPYPVSGECINLDFSTAFTIPLSESSFQQLMSPLRYRIKTNVAGGSSEDQFTRTVDEFHVDMTSFLQGEIVIDSLQQSSSATVACQLRLSRHLFTEFQIERQSLGYLEIRNLSNIPSVWLSEGTPNDDCPTDQKSGRHRLGLITNWPFSIVKIETVIEVPSDCHDVDFDIHQPLFCSEGTLQTLYSTVDAKLEIEIFSERILDQSSEESWVRNSVHGHAEFLFQQLNQQVTVNTHFDGLTELSSKLTVRLQIDPPVRPSRPIEHIVPPVAKTPSHGSMLSGKELFSNTVRAIIDMLKSKYNHNQNIDDIKESAEIDGTLMLAREMLKKPLASIISELFPRMSQQDLKSATNLCKLYETMTYESRRAFAQSFSNMFEEQTYDADGNRTADLTLKIKEALIDGNEPLQIRLLREEALQFSITTMEGVQSRTQYVKALFRFGAVEEGADMLMQMIARHQQDVELRRMLACALMERDPKSDDAAALLRLDLESSPDSDIAFSLRTVSQLMRDDNKLALQNIARAKFKNINVFTISAVYALQLGLPNIAKFANDRNTEAVFAVEMLVLQARTWILLKQYDRAIECFQKVLSENPDDYDSLKDLSFAYFSIEMKNEAAKCWERILLNRPRTDFVTCARLGKHYLDIGCYSLAIAALTMSVQQERLALTWKWLGDAYRLSNNHVHAVHALSQANLLDRYDAEIWALLVICCLELNRLHEARHAIRVLVDVGPILRKDLQDSIMTGIAKCGFDEFIELNECFSL